jgi:outer membrane murein-binding lipoprotein Lpp
MSPGRQNPPPVDVDFEETQESPGQDARSGPVTPPIAPVGVRGERRPQGQLVRIFTPTDTPAVQDATKRELERKGYQVERAPESTVSASVAPSPSRRGDAPWWRSADSFLKVAGGLALLAGGGLAGKAATGADKPAPGVADAPAQIAELRGDVARLRDRVSSAERDSDEARADARRTARRLEQTITELETIRRGMPKIEGQIPAR